MPLNERVIRSIKPTLKPKKLSDQGGLYLLIQPSGSRWWRVRYRFEGREQLLSVGTFPTVSLDDARCRRDEIRWQVSRGIDPSAKRKADKAASASTFEDVAREWWKKRRHLWKGKYSGVILKRFERYIFPYIGKRPIGRLSAADFYECLESMEKHGVLETAHKMRSKCSAVMRYAVATRRAERDPVVDLRGALAPVKPVHYAAITVPAEVGRLLRAIDGYCGKSHVVHCALKLLPLVFVRSAELRYANWSEIEFDSATWRIPASRMKRPLPHLVPLSSQALRILKELRALTGADRFIFPGLRSVSRPISENSINAALRTMGYSREEMTGHGFRSMASTLLNEQGWSPDAIERQLAHLEPNDVRAAYNYAQYLTERRRMMQAWADYLDALRTMHERSSPDVNSSVSRCSHRNLRTGHQSG